MFAQLRVRQGEIETKLHELEIEIVKLKKRD
jgi:hypothetical protein